MLYPLLEALVAILLALIVLMCPAVATAQATQDLFAAAVAEDLSALAAILDAGADPNQRDALGRTPLMHAATLGRMEAARVLLDQGADTRYRDRALWTAGMHARESGHSALADLLGERRTRQSVLNASGVRLRSHPDLGGEVLGLLREGEAVALVATTAEETRIGDLVDHWCRVRTGDGRVGWAFGAYVDVDPRILDPAAVLNVLAWRVWTQLRRVDGRWVADPADEATPTLELWLSEQDAPRITHFLGQGQETDLYGVTSITDWGDQLVLTLEIIYMAERLDGGVLPEAVVHPGEPGTGVVGWTMPRDGADIRWCAPEDGLERFRAPG